MISKIKNLANLIWQRPVYQYLLFGVATLMSIGLMGYYFGTFDQASHIPFLKKNADPTLFPGDTFFDLRKNHYSYFWLLFIPFYRIGILEITMFIVYVISIFLTFWALWRLSKTLFNNPLTSFLTVIIFAIPHLSFGIFPVIEFSLLNRTFALPFLLIAIDFYLKRKFFLSFLILGLLYNLHIISVNFVMSMILFDAFLNFKNIGLKKIITGILLFIITSLPVTVWKFVETSSVDVSVNKVWFSIMDRSIFFHLYNLISTNIPLDIVTIGAVGSIIMFFIAKKNLPKNPINKSVANFIYAVILILLVEFVTARWLPVTIIIQSQIIRVGVWAIIFGYLYFISYIVNAYQNKSLRNSNFILLVLSSIFSLFPSIVVVVWFIQRFITSKNLLKIIGVLLIVVFAASGLFAYKTQVWQPGIHIFPQKTAYTDTQIWARDNTPTNAMFITPPYTWWFYNNEWRVVSERPTVVALADLLESIFFPEYMKVWQPKFEALAPGALQQFKGDYFQNTIITARAYYSLTTQQFKTLAQKYNASYLVVEKGHQYDFPIAYENEGYVVYKLLF